MKNENLRVQTFQVENGTIQELDDEINKWLTLQRQVEIVDRKQTESCCAYIIDDEPVVCWNLTVSIMYQPINKGIRPTKLNNK